MRLRFRHLKAELLQKVSSFQSSGEKVMTRLKDLHKDSPFGCLIPGRQDPLQAASFLFLHGVGMTLKHCKKVLQRNLLQLSFSLLGSLNYSPYRTVSGFMTVQCDIWWCSIHKQSLFTDKKWWEWWVGGLHIFF